MHNGKEWFMPRTLLYALSVIAGYLLGSISVSILISSHIYHQDIRSAGSGNAGATNAARVFGMKAGVLTFLGDFLKTLLALGVGSLLAGTTGACFSGAAALIGHCFPVYYGFRGGKGVSTGAAVALCVDWRVFLAAMLVFAIAAYLSKRASVASISAALVLTIGAALLAVSPAQRVLGIFAGVLVIFMHRSNIKRLLAGTEPQFHPGTSPNRKK